MKAQEFCSSYEAGLFQLQEPFEGNLTNDWAAVDANEIRSGTLRVGGFAGSGTPIPAQSKGSIIGVVFAWLYNRLTKNTRD